LFVEVVNVKADAKRIYVKVKHEKSLNQCVLMFDISYAELVSKLTGVELEMPKKEKKLKKKPVEPGWKVRKGFMFKREKGVTEVIPIKKRNED